MSISKAMFGWIMPASAISGNGDNPCVLPAPNRESKSGAEHSEIVLARKIDTLEEQLEHRERRIFSLASELRRKDGEIASRDSFIQKLTIQGDAFVKMHEKAITDANDFISSLSAQGKVTVAELEAALEEANKRIEELRILENETQEKILAE